MSIVLVCGAIQDVIVAAWKADPELGGAGIIVDAPRLRDLPNAVDSLRVDLSFSPEITSNGRLARSPETFSYSCKLVVACQVDRDVPAPPVDGSDPATRILDEVLRPFAALVETKTDRILQELPNPDTYPAFAPGGASLIGDSGLEAYRVSVDAGGNRLRAVGVFEWVVEVVLPRAADLSLLPLAGIDADYNVDHEDDPAAQDVVNY